MNVFNSSRFIWYWIITWSFMGVYFAGGWYFVDKTATLLFLTYALISGAILGLIRYLVLETFWRKLE